MTPANLAVVPAPAPEPEPVDAASCKATLDAKVKELAKLSKERGANKRRDEKIREQVRAMLKEMGETTYLTEDGEDEAVIDVRTTFPADKEVAKRILTPEQYDAIFHAEVGNVLTVRKRK